MNDDVICECGYSMINKKLSTPNWIVYDCVCSKCGLRSEKAAAKIKELVLDGLKKGKKR